MSEAVKLRRMPLRDLLSHSDRKCRELVEHLQMDLAPTVGEVYDLTRPHRKRSHFPHVRALLNNCEKLRKSLDYAEQVQVEIIDYVTAVKARSEEG